MACARMTRRAQRPEERVGVARDGVAQNSHAHLTAAKRSGLAHRRLAGEHSSARHRVRAVIVSSKGTVTHPRSSSRPQTCREHRPQSVRNRTPDNASRQQGPDARPRAHSALAEAPRSDGRMRTPGAHAPACRNAEHRTQNGAHERACLAPARNPPARPTSSSAAARLEAPAHLLR